MRPAGLLKEGSQGDPENAPGSLSDRFGCSQQGPHCGWVLTGHPPGPFEAHIPLHASPHRLAGTCCLSAPQTHPCPCISEALALPGSHRAREGHSPAPPSLPCFVILGAGLLPSWASMSSGTREAGSPLAGCQAGRPTQKGRRREASSREKRDLHFRHADSFTHMQLCLSHMLGTWMWHHHPRTDPFTPPRLCTRPGGPLTISSSSPEQR